MHSDVILSIEDLSIGVRTVDGDGPVLVEGVSLELHRGEVLALVGESGSGKSVTMMSVMGLLPEGVEVLSGSVVFQGRDLLRMDPAELRGLRGGELAMVFQDPMTAMNPVKRIGAQIARAVKVHNRGLSRAQVTARVHELLEMVGIDRPAEAARAYPHQWSGGMRQRALIAMAMANGPSLLIADEPTTALDVTIQAQVMKVLAEARKASDAGMVLITHDLGLVAQVADTIRVMYSGGIVEAASVWDVFDRAAHPYTIGLLGSLLSGGQENGRAKAIGGLPPSPAERPAGCPFAPRCDNPAKSAPSPSPAAPACGRSAS
jgi:peptide/nickel transport system ATP-binding protein